MPFPRKLLAEHEKIIFDLRPHWMALVPPVLWSVVFAALALLAGNYVYKINDRYQWWEIVLTIALLAGWASLAVVPFLRWHFTNFVLTTDRLITRYGVVAKRSKEILLERINDVAFNQTVFERIVGAGDLLIESAGERGQERITNVRKPEEVQLMIFKATENNTLRTASAPTAAEQLEALARLRDQGILSEEEFNAKKKELLDRI